MSLRSTFQYQNILRAFAREATAVNIELETVAQARSFRTQLLRYTKKVRQGFVDSEDKETLMMIAENIRTRLNGRQLTVTATPPKFKNKIVNYKIVT